MISAVGLVLLFTGCQERAEEPAVAVPAATTTFAATGAPTAAQSQPPAGGTTVRDAGDAERLTVVESEGALDISLTTAAGKRVLRGDPRDTGKRKYSVDGGAVAYEVKPGDDSSFKLRTADGKLLWKVKVSQDKIKISNNEENKNPFELKVREGDRVKIVGPGDRELGNVRFDRATSRTKVEDAAGKTLFLVDRPAPSGAYGVLLLDAIPEVERAILVGEILSRGR